MTNTYPFAVAMLVTLGQSPKYFVTRRVVGGIYSDYFEHEKDAERARHTLESEASGTEQQAAKIAALESGRAELATALEYMLNECGHLEKEGDYDFANERAVLAQYKAQ